MPRKLYNITESEYKGSPVINFGESPTWPTTLGRAKIACVIDNIEACLSFLERHGETEVVAEFKAKFKQEAKVTA